MRLHDLLDMPDLKLQAVVADEHYDPIIRWVVTTDMLDPSRYLSGGELVLTGLVWRTGPADSESFVRSIAKAGAAAVAASEGGVVPQDLIDACRAHGIPLFRVPADIAFATVTESVVRRLSTARASDLTAVLDRHRRLVASTGPGTGLGPLLELVGTDLGMDCWVITASGRVLAGSESMPDASALARDFLRARRMPCSSSDGVSMFPVDGESTSRVVDWFLAFRSDWQTWPSERLGLAEELGAIVALERARADDRLTVTGRLSQEFVRLTLSGAGAAETVSQMDVIGLDTESSYVAVAAAAPGGTIRLGELRALVRELVEPFRSTIGLFGDEAVALVAVDSDLTDRVKAVVDSLAPGLKNSDLSVGVSGVVSSRELRGAIEEARYARQLAVGRTDTERVVGHDELATLVLLLASVPDDVRTMFRSRLLDPLAQYDHAHNSDLVPTLSAFLDCNGSWTRCAEQMHLHVNSVRYRVQRIEDMTGRDLSTLEDRVEFFLALRLR